MPVADQILVQLWGCIKCRICASVSIEYSIVTGRNTILQSSIKKTGVYNGVFNMKRKYWWWNIKPLGNKLCSGPVGRRACLPSSCVHSGWHEQTPDAVLGLCFVGWAPALDTGTQSAGCWDIPYRHCWFSRWPAASIWSVQILFKKNLVLK